MTSSSTSRRMDAALTLPASYIAGFEGDAKATVAAAVVGEVRSYGRFSAESSKESSIERQDEHAAAYAKERLGRTIRKTYSDRGVSGTTMIGRKGMADALSDAEAGLYKELVVEDVDRLARDVGLACLLFRRLTRAGVRIHSTTKMGVLEEMDIVIRGFFSAQQLDRLKFLTRMGRRKAAEQGRSPHGPCWGLLRVPFKPGEAVIDEAVRPIIEWIFEARLAGMTQRRIARLLIARGIPSARGTTWSPMSVRHVLRNPRRAGVFVYGRSRHSFNPDSGVVDVKPVAAQDWVVVEVPEWRIVSYESWLAAQAMDAEYRETCRGRSHPGQRRNRVREAASVRAHSLPPVRCRDEHT